MNKNTPAHYTGIAKFLHWMVALIIMMMLVFGQGFDDIKTDTEMAYSLMGHSSLGLTVIGLIILRILWRIGNPPPALPETVNRAQKTMANISHILLYALMIYVPLTGLFTIAQHEIAAIPYGAFDLRAALSFLQDSDYLARWDFDSRRFLHEVGTWLLIALLAVHILAAFLHQFVQKDGILRRMWFGKAKPANQIKG